MRHLYNFRILKKRRRSLRQQPIPSEIRMWSVLRNRQFHNVKFRRQYSIGLYIIDFYCPGLHLAIEIDGDSHFLSSRQQRDQYRQRWLEERGITVVRFYSLDVILSLDGVMMELDQLVTKLIAQSHHLPS